MGKKKKKKGKITWPWIFLPLFILSVLSIYWYETQIRPTTPIGKIIASKPHSDYPIGIDISHHQGEINWNRLLKQEHFDTLIKFVYFKVSEGENHLDREWEKNRKVLNEYSIPCGAYHFYQPKKDPIVQAHHFLKHYKHHYNDLPPVLDIEIESFPSTEFIHNIKRWLNEVKKQTGITPIIYTSKYLYNTHFLKGFDTEHFWIASYGSDPGFIDDPRILIWQYSEKGALPGISEKTDLNLVKPHFFEITSPQ